MHIRHRQFMNATNLPRHLRLFELIRQENTHTRRQATDHQSQDQAMEAFRDMACASLGR
ncbi:MAG: hypothetical protein ACRBBO_08505 [Cognatishimia sp.]